MISFNCIIQEGVIEDELRPCLVAELAQASVSILGGDPSEVEVKFAVIPHGYGFRGGELSTTSMVRGTVTPGCPDQETRVRLMQAISDAWMGQTGCSVDELVVSARDSQ